MSKLSFDGFGINGPDKYRTRIATFTNDEAGKAYGKLFEASPDLLAALELVYEAMIHNPAFSTPYKGRDGWEFSPEGKARAAIAKAKGGAL